jgi:hypothetical protein
MLSIINQQQTMINEYRIEIRVRRSIKSAELGVGISKLVTRPEIG